MKRCEEAFSQLFEAARALLKTRSAHDYDDTQIVDKAALDKLQEVTDNLTRWAIPDFSLPAPPLSARVIDPEK
jgi:hypothetical protein